MSATYHLAASASSTAALAASNTATNASTAATYYAKALQCIMHAMNSPEAVTESDVRAYITECMQGAENAAEEAKEARHNAAAAYAVAAHAASELELGTEAETETENEEYVTSLDSPDWDNITVHLDRSVIDDWEADSTFELKSLWSGPDADADSDSASEVYFHSTAGSLGQCSSSVYQSAQGSVVETLWDADCALAHAESNNITYPTPPPSENGTDDKPNPKPKARWGKSIGDWCGGLQTKTDAAGTMFTAYGEITEILPFDIFVTVEPTDEYPASSFSAVSEDILRQVAADDQPFVYKVPMVGEMAWGFLDMDQPGDELKAGFGRVVDVTTGEKVYLIRNGNEDMGVLPFEDVVEFTGCL